MMIVHNHERGDEPRTLRDEREVEIAKKWNALMEALREFGDECNQMVMCRRCPGHIFCEENFQKGFVPDALEFPGGDEQEDANDAG